MVFRDPATKHGGIVAAAATEVRQRLGRPCGEDVLFLPPPSVPPGRPQMLLGPAATYGVRVACAAFWLLLTCLLLVPDPRALLGIERWADRLPDPKAAHVLCFSLLAILAHLSRFPLSRLALLGTLAAYAIAAEALQSFVPPRTASVGDVVWNLSGLAIGTLPVVRQVRGPRLPLHRRIGMNEGRNRGGRNHVQRSTAFPHRDRGGAAFARHVRHRAERSAPAKAGCLVVINERDGAVVTVHRDRLVPVETVGPPILYHESRTACLKCGRVEGVVEDHVTCPFHGDIPCGLLEARRALVQLASPTAAR